MKKSFPIPVKGVVLTVILVVTIVLCAFMMSGCYGPRKAAKQWDRAYQRHKEVVDIKTATFYPVRVFDSTRTVFKAGLPVDRHDTVTQRDTVSNLVTRTITNSRTIHDTVTNEHFRQVESRAAADSAIHVADMYRTKMQSDAVKAAEKEASLKTRNKIMLWAAISGWALVIGGIAIKLLKAKARLI